MRRGVLPSQGRRHHGRTSARYPWSCRWCAAIGWRRPPVLIATYRRCLHGCAHLGLGLVRRQRSRPLRVLLLRPRPDAARAHLPRVCVLVRVLHRPGDRLRCGAAARLGHRPWRGVLRRIHHREEPLGGQPVRLPDHHDPLCGASALPAEGPPRRCRDRPVPAGHVHLGRAAAIAEFSWVFYLFGAFLVYTAVKLAQEDHDSEVPAEYHENRLLQLVRRVVPSTTEYDSDRVSVVRNGRRLATPMLVVMVAIGSTDVLFALDSIPAIFGLTKEPYIVFTTNAFALLGLRQLYFLLGGLLRRLVYLSEGLSVILAFIGVKLVLEALHTNELPFINGGQPVAWAPEIPIWLSLMVILGTLTVATVASPISTRRAVQATG